MHFAEAARLSAAFTRTENGAVALNTTGDARLDFFGTVGSLRTADSAAALVRDRRSARSCSTWPNTIRRGCVPTWI